MEQDGWAIKGAGRVPYREKDWRVGTVADFDADGVPDILWRNTNGDRAVWYMDEDGRAIKGTSVAPH
jgi:hypothetical protein